MEKKLWGKKKKKKNQVADKQKKEKNTQIWVSLDFRLLEGWTDLLISAEATFTNFPMVVSELPYLSSFFWGIIMKEIQWKLYY